MIKSEPSSPIFVTNIEPVHLCTWADCTLWTHSLTVSHLTNFCCLLNNLYTMLVLNIPDINIQKYVSYQVCHKRLKLCSHNKTWWGLQCYIFRDPRAEAVNGSTVVCDKIFHCFSFLSGDWTTDWLVCWLLPGLAWGVACSAHCALRTAHLTPHWVTALQCSTFLSKNGNANLRTQ